jgi:RNA polymerase sigma-70 factor (ECF subfamily)
VALRQDEFNSLCDDVDLDRDRALVERCQAGDSAAFGNLYARYYERLLRFCMRRLNDRHEAEDAAQEAFARAWKALPQFAGERRFYPWLTVIAGNICTDMLRRRSRSTPTDDVELGHHPMGGGAETSEELVLASVDGELVNRALGRLSTRHRHVLAMREGSGWSYQQIADHEGVEIGTIETLLWRARQALKREFTVLSESKGALAGFLAGTGALARRTILRVAHRGAMVQSSGGGMSSGGLRNAVVGVAVTGAAVAAAVITPQVLSAPHTSHPAQAVAPSNISAANPGIPLGPVTNPSTDSLANQLQAVTVAAGIEGAGSAAATSGGTVKGTALHATGTPTTAGDTSGSPLSAGTNGVLPTGTGLPTGVTNPLTNPNNPVGSITAPVITNVGQAVNTLASTVGGLANTLGLNQIIGQLGLPGVGSSSGTTGSGTGATGTTTTTNPVSGLISGVGTTVNNTLKGLLGKK